MNIQNNTIKRMAALLACLCLMPAMCVTAYAHEVPDLARTGSLSVTMAYDGEAVPGGTLTLYRVGAVSGEDGNYSFALTGEFAKSRISLEDISSTALAGSLAGYADSKGLAGTEVKIENDGRADIDGLELGLYLLVQTKAAAGYEAAMPFLVSLPMYQDGAYAYHVDAAPKMEALKRKPGKPAKPADPILPQTGQLNWPVPFLAFLGLGLFLLGFMLRFGKKDLPYET